MDEKLLLEQIDAFVAENRENVLRDLKTLVDINSVEGQPQPGAPFGPGPKKALEAALDIAAGMGLDAHNCEGYIGYADLPGASPTQIATITHLDVVPRATAGQAPRLIWCAATAMSWDAAWPTTKAPLY